MNPFTLPDSVQPIKVKECSHWNFKSYIVKQRVQDINIDSLIAKISDFCIQ